MNILIVYPHGGILNPKDGAESKIYFMAKVLSKKNKIYLLESNRGYTNVKTRFVDGIYFFDIYNIRHLKLGVLLMDLNPSYIRKLIKILHASRYRCYSDGFSLGGHNNKFVS